MRAILCAAQLVWISPLLGSCVTSTHWVNSHTTQVETLRSEQQTRPEAAAGYSASGRLLLDPPRLEILVRRTYAREDVRITQQRERVIHIRKGFCTRLNTGASLLMILVPPLGIGWGIYSAIVGLTTCGKVRTRLELGKPRLTVKSEGKRITRSEPAARVTLEVRNPLGVSSRVNTDMRGVAVLPWTRQLEALDARSAARTSICVTAECTPLALDAASYETTRLRFTAQPIMLRTELPTNVPPWHGKSMVAIPVRISNVGSRLARSVHILTQPSEGPGAFPLVPRHPRYHVGNLAAGETKQLFVILDRSTTPAAFVPHRLLRLVVKYNAQTEDTGRRPDVTAFQRDFSVDESGTVFGDSAPPSELQMLLAGTQHQGTLHAAQGARKALFAFVCGSTERWSAIVRTDRPGALSVAVDGVLPSRARSQASAPGLEVSILCTRGERPRIFLAANEGRALAYTISVSVTPHRIEGAVARRGERFVLHQGSDGLVAVGQTGSLFLLRRGVHFRVARFRVVSVARRIAEIEITRWLSATIRTATRFQIDPLPVQ